MAVKVGRKVVDGERVEKRDAGAGDERTGAAVEVFAEITAHQ